MNMAVPVPPDKDFPFPPADAVVVGGGPAGLRAAEVLAAGGASVAVYEQTPSVGRKFLVAGRGGLNLTHSEDVERFVTRYRDELPRWRALLAGFGPAELRAWADGLGVETYVGTSGRVFPRGQQAAALLRRWVSRLRTTGVRFHVGHRLEGIAPAKDGHHELRFRELRTGESVVTLARAVVLALGGTSWPETGSDGTWPAVLTAAVPGLPISPWQPANCGWEVDWHPRVLELAEGQPLKNIAATAGGRTVRGELLITRYGLEGGAVYQLGPELRAAHLSVLEIDFKPDTSHERLASRPWQSLKLASAARALLEWQGVAASIKRFPLTLRGPRPVAEAISAAGGVAWSAVDGELMLRARPGLFVAGEMIDWEAPTGGYLLQGCFATGTHAGQAAARWLAAGSVNRSAS